MVQKTADMISAVFFIVFFNFDRGRFRYLTSCSIFELLILWISDQICNHNWNNSFTHMTFQYSGLIPVRLTWPREG